MASSRALGTPSRLPSAGAEDGGGDPPDLLGSDGEESAVDPLQIDHAAVEQGALGHDGHLVRGAFQGHAAGMDGEVHRCPQ